MIMPFYLLMIVPMLLLQSPGVRLDGRTALVPVANVMLMVRGAIQDSIEWPVVALAAVASLVFISVIIALTAFILRFEDVVVGSYSGTFIKLVKTRLLRRNTTDAQWRGSRG
jgi:hypothetical protein